MSMTPEELSRLRELCEKATAGPWGATLNDQSAIGLDVAKVGARRVYKPGYYGPMERPEDDAEFIAASRTALPQLLDEVERLRDDTAEASLRSAQHAEDLETANKLIDQTIEVLEGFEADGDDVSGWEWYVNQAQPLLRKLTGKPKPPPEQRFPCPGIGREGKICESPNQCDLGGCIHTMGRHRPEAKPLLDNLKALKKEAE